MSTPWLNDVQPFPLENGLLNPPVDSNSFMHMNHASSPFDYDSVQNQQRMQNGTNTSPALQNMYQTQSIVGTKRPRPREDSIGASPRQAPGMLPPSRSETPQQGVYPGFQTPVNGSQNFQAPNPYHRFSNAGSNASLSPSMQSQPYNAQGPSRVQTVSPSPFSPEAQNFGSQASPPPQSEHASRVNTPHNVPVNYMQTIPYGGAPNHPFTPPPNSNGVPAQPPQNIQQQQQQQRMHEMRQRQFYHQQLQANNAAMQNRYPGMGPNPSMNSSGQMPGMMAAGGRMQHPQQSASRILPFEHLVRNIAPWMQARGLPFNPNPTVLGRPVNLFQLFQAVMRIGGPGGSKVVTARGQWPMVAQHLHIPPAQLVVAANELQIYWQSNVMQYEMSYLQSQQQQRQRAMQEQARLQRPPQNGEVPSAQDPYSPMKPREAHPQDLGPSQAAPAQTPTQNGFAIPLTRHDHQQPDAHAIQANGYNGSLDVRRTSGQSRPKPQMPNQSYTSPSQPDRFHTKTSTATKRAKPRDQGENGYPRRPHSPRKERYSPMLEDFPDPDQKSLERYGGLHIDAVKVLGDDVSALRPTMPLLQELGFIDIQALTLSLRSGIHGEVRLALDIFCALSLQMDLDLTKCGDLVDALVECGEEQVDFLAENAAEVSDDMLMDCYEDMTRAWRLENLAFQMPPEFGSLEFDLDRAVDRLICITTCFRNFSSHERNWDLIGTSAVISLMANIMRYLGTRNMLLRSYKSTLDFAKDAVTYLSNISLSIKLPSKEDALSVLYFLLSFAPSPSPVVNSDSKVTFASYEPSLHTHLPTAIDCLAKLLARDEPNRGFFRSIFLADNASSPPFELLTKAFGFTIAVMPRNETDEQRLNQIVQVRAPYLAQALLAAETLTTLIPPSDHSLAKAWLTSEDGFAVYLIKTVIYMGGHLPARPPPNSRQPPNPRLQEVEDIFEMVSYRGLCLLRKLAEKAKDAEPDGTRFPLGILPSKESLLSILMTGHFESALLRQLYSYATLET